MADKVSYRKDPEQVKKSLRFSIFDGSAYSVMQGFGQSYISAFAIALKASTTMIGVLSSLPDLIGALFQLFATSIVEKLGSRKKIILVCAFFQALLWLPLFLVPAIFQKFGPLLLVIFLCAVFICSYLISPLWNSWMGDLVPEDERGRYFGKRNAIIGVFVFLGTFVAGLLLHIFSDAHPLIGFGILFFIAFIARLVSVYYLSKMDDVPYAVDKKSYFSFADFIKRMAYNNYGRFVLFICLLNFVVYIAAPFFTVYMLRDLKFDYATFMLITVASLISGFIGMYIWGKINDRYGSKRLLVINGVLVAFVPLFWLMTKNIFWLYVIETYSGFVWAGFNLGAANFIFDATTPQKRTRCIVYYNVLKGIFIFAGATLGGILATHIKPGAFFTSAILVLFLISGILRLVIALMFIPLLREMRLIEIPVGHSVFSTPLTIKPREGIVYEALGTYKKEPGANNYTERLKPSEKLPNRPPGRF